MAEGLVGAGAVFCAPQSSSVRSVQSCISLLLGTANNSHVNPCIRQFFHRNKRAITVDYVYFQQIITPSPSFLERSRHPYSIVIVLGQVTCLGQCGISEHDINKGLKYTCMCGLCLFSSVCKSKEN